MATSNKALIWGIVKDYLESINMISGLDIQLVKEIFSQGQALCPEKLKTIFISNYKEPNGKEQFKDLWLFSDNYVLEVLNFSKQETLKLEMTIFSSNIHSITIEADNLALSQKAKNNSKLRVVFYTLTDFTCDYTASGSNCDALMSIYEKYVKQNLVRGHSADLL